MHLFVQLTVTYLERDSLMLVVSCDLLFYDMSKIAKTFSYCFFTTIKICFGTSSIWFCKFLSIFIYVFKTLWVVLRWIGVIMVHLFLNTKLPLPKPKHHISTKITFCLKIPFIFSWSLKAKFDIYDAAINRLNAYISLSAHHTKLEI